MVMSATAGIILKYIIAELPDMKSTHLHITLKLFLFVSS